jgi:hypothetical protein
MGICADDTPELQVSAPPRFFVTWASLSYQVDRMLYNLDPGRLQFLALVRYSMQAFDSPLSNFARLLRDVLLGVTVLVGSFYGTLYGLDHGVTDFIKKLNAPRPLPPHDDIVFARSDLLSELPGQPLPEGRPELVVAPEGHPDGHILSTVPRELAPGGSYEFEMELAVQRSPTSGAPQCIMDVLAGTRVIGSKELPEAPAGNGQHQKIDILFTSPGPLNVRTFQARLWCNGRAAVTVYRLMLFHYHLS